MESHSPPPPLTSAEKREAFKLATRSFPKRNADAIKRGMTDDELETALKNYLGIFGGSGGPNRLSITFQGSGLKIWGGWHTVNHLKEKPLFLGTHTIAMARETYRISDPSDEQGSLF